MGNGKTKLTKQDKEETPNFEELKDWWHRIHGGKKKALLTFQEVC